MTVIDTDTTKNIDFYKHWYKPHTGWGKIDKNWCRLNEYYSFNYEKLKLEVDSLLEEYKLKPFPISTKKNKKRWTYRGIGLTSNPSSEDPLYDSLKLYSKDGEIDISDTFDAMAVNNEESVAPQLYEKGFSEKTKIYRGYLGEILDRFKSPMTKARILSLKPKGVITPHVDFPYYKQIRVHTVLASNSETWWEVEGERFKLPADGHWYWFDTGKYHAVWNDGDTDRLIVSVNLSLYEDRDENPRNTNKKIEDLIVSKNL